MSQAEGYVRGACFDGMGWHYFKDLLAPNGTISWQASNLMPVVPMYDRNAGWRLNAVFFAAPFVQQSALPPSANQWEPVPLPNFAMCKNWCDKDCGWKGTRFWSTMHLYFSDPHAVVCEDGCKMACCEAG